MVERAARLLGASSAAREECRSEVVEAGEEILRRGAGERVVVLDQLAMGVVHARHADLEVRLPLQFGHVLPPALRAAAT